MTDQHVREIDQASPRQTFVIEADQANELWIIAEPIFRVGAPSQLGANVVIRDRLNDWWMRMGLQHGFRWTTVSDLIWRAADGCEIDPVETNHQIANLSFTAEAEPPTVFAIERKVWGVPFVYRLAQVGPWRGDDHTMFVCHPDGPFQVSLDPAARKRIKDGECRAIDVAAYLASGEFHALIEHPESKKRWAQMIFEMAGIIDEASPVVRMVAATAQMTDAQVAAMAEGYAPADAYDGPVINLVRKNRVGTARDVVILFRDKARAVLAGEFKPAKPTYTDEQRKKASNRLAVELSVGGKRVGDLVDMVAGELGMEKLPASE